MMAVTSSTSPGGCCTRMATTSIISVQMTVGAPINAYSAWNWTKTAAHQLPPRAMLYSPQPMPPQLCYSLTDNYSLGLSTHPACRPAE